MSQLNNRRFDKRKRNKNQFTFNVIFSTILICAILIVLTIFAIDNKNHNTEEKNKIENEIEKQITRLENDGILPVKLTDKYKQNDLKTYPKTHEANYYKHTNENGNTEEIPKLEINYYQIEGLANKEIENKINEEIKNTAFNMYNKELLDDENVFKITVDTYVLANYADVLSVQITENIIYNNNENHSNLKYLNYELTNGQKIQFKDIFTYNTAIKPIIANSAYENFAWSYDNNDEDGLDNDMSKVDYSDLENRIYNVVKEYENSREINFGFNEKYIFVVLNNNTISIDMSKIYDNIAIYNRYKTFEDIYEYENIGTKNIFVFSSRPTDSYYTLIEDEENCYIDVAIYGDENVPDKFLEQQKQVLQTRIAEIKNTLKSNSNEAILYGGYVYIGVDAQNNEIYVSNELARYEMDKSYYDRTFYNKIGEQAREDKVDIGYYINYDEIYVKYVSETSYAKYNLTTLEKIEED